MNCFVRTALPLAVMLLLGCQQESPQFESRPTFPVQGRVLINGKPAAGVQVFFHPQDELQRGKPRGITDAEGRFHLRTYHDGDGAPAGQYTITLYWPAPYKSNMPAEDQMPPDRLGQRYMNPKASTLRATVAAGPTTLPTLELK
jgi:hypothetical protein